jgi:hypothetical protein
MMSAPNAMSGRSGAEARAEAFDRVGARMPALHALQDHVVAGLKRQMQMRHQPLLLGEISVEQVLVASIASIDDSRSRGRSGTSAGSRDQLPELRLARQVAP